MTLLEMVIAKPMKIFVICAAKPNSEICLLIEEKHAIICVISQYLNQMPRKTEMVLGCGPQKLQKAKLLNKYLIGNKYYF